MAPDGSFAGEGRAGENRVPGGGSKSLLRSTVLRGIDGSSETHPGFRRSYCPKQKGCSCQYLGAHCAVSPSQGRNLPSGFAVYAHYSYFSDVAIPFGMYFLLYQNEVRIRFLRDWRAKALLVFGASSLTEVLQAFGVPLLGQTFDPLDFVMFGGGVLLAALVERSLIQRMLQNWPSRTGDPSDLTPKYSAAHRGSV